MRNNDSAEYMTAFVIGAVIGAGAALLLRPEPKTRAQRIMGQLAPVARKAGKAARHAGKQYSRSIEMGRRATEDLTDAGKDAIDQFQRRVEDILAEARDDMSDGIRDARKAVKRKLRQVRS